MHSGDVQEVCVSDVVLDCGTEEALVVVMEQLVQAAIGVEPYKEQLVNDEQSVNEEEVVQ
jgi:hypothetical protein